MPEKQKRPERFAVETDYQGKHYVGSYSLDRYVITVNFESKSTTAHLRLIPPENFAKFVLGTMVREWLAEQGSKLGKE